MRGLLTRGILATAVLCIPLIGRLAAQQQPDVLTADQAVKIALANHRTLKITSLQLDDTKQSYLAFKTHRYSSFIETGRESRRRPPAKTYADGFFTNVAAV